ncbi:hypothetical protein OG819_00280 [Streptomyces sp. NBC_01549]|nr:hypothetical protein [Streptomyces sp. NBC_01549]MCX4588242.1 hypothetical protein [Streptomyces sp. NBC_01549]
MKRRYGTDVDHYGLFAPPRVQAIAAALAAASAVPRAGLPHPTRRK